MVYIKDAPRTATTIVIRSESNSRVTHSRTPFFNIMRRLFSTDSTAKIAQKFVIMIEERQNAGDSIKTEDWKQIIEALGINRSSFYSMRNKLLGAGMITIRGGEYKTSNQFALDLLDMANWWKSAINKEKVEEI